MMINLKKYNSILKSKGNFVKNLGEDFNIIYQKFKSIFVVSSRDFVLLTKKFVNKDNSITITGINYIKYSLIYRLS